MRLPLVIAALAAALLAAAPATADAPPDGFARRPVASPRPLPPRYAPPAGRFGYGAPRRHAGRRMVAAGPGFGPVPPFFVGTGAAADHLYGTPVQLTLYREAYIGHGLVYNTPPTLDVPGPVLSARY